jgi:Putative Ig domain
MPDLRLVQLLGMATILTSIVAMSGCGGDESASTASASASQSASVTVSANPGTAQPPAGTTTPPLTVSGTPPTSVVANAAYKFQPTTSAASGAVTYTIAGAPRWATFDKNTGLLAGTPATSDEGFTGHIEITASDGKTTASIAPFTINVVSPITSEGGAAMLTWVPPKQNEDGTPVTNLAGFHIYFGTDASALTSDINVADASSTSYTIKGLSAGVYYFTVVAYNSLGTESDNSNIADQTI